MYSVVQIGGHQYKVQPGDVIDVQKIEGEVGKDVKLDQVLFVGGETPKVGLPVVDKANVVARVLKQERDRKVIVFKRKPGLSRTKRGHRQYYTSLLITEVNDGAGQSEKIAKDSPAAKKYLK